MKDVKLNDKFWCVNSIEHLPWQGQVTAIYDENVFKLSKLEINYKTDIVKFDQLYATEKEALNVYLKSLFDYMDFLRKQIKQTEINIELTRQKKDVANEHTRN